MLFHEILRKPVTIETVIITFFVIGLVAGNVLLGLKTLEYKTDVQKLNKKISLQENTIKNERELSDFFAFFIAKILVSDGEITFDDRLELENRVRELGDEEILEHWSQFTHSADEAMAQEEVRILLNIIADKVQGNLN